MLAKESPPDIVLLDWMIEGISGIEVCRRLRRTPGTANVPIIMITGRGEESDRIRGLETGADDYVTKPFSPRELIARVGAVLRRVRPALAGEQLRFADLEMDLAGHKVRRGGADSRWARPSSGCCATSWSIPAASSRASGCSTWSGAATRRSRSRTVDVHIRRLRQALSFGGKPELIRTVRSAGYALDDDAA